MSYIVLTVASSIVRRAASSFVGRGMSYTVGKAVSDVTCRSPWSVVSRGIRSAVAQVAGGVMCRVTRPAIAPVTSPVVAEAIPPAICENTISVVPHITTGVLFRGFGDSPSEQLRLTRCGTVPIRPSHGRSPALDSMPAPHRIRTPMYAIQGRDEGIERPRD